MDNTTVLGVHLDALTLTVSREYSLPDDRVGEWRAAKVRMQESGDSDAAYELGEIAGVPGGPFRLLPTGRGRYQFRFRNDRYYVEGSVWANLPTLIIKPLAACLYEYPDLDAQEVLARRICGFFVEDEQARLRPSRCDVAVDFQSEDFVIPERRDIATDARKVNYHYEGLEAVTVTAGERSNSVQVQLYDKSREIDKSGKEWMIDVWESSGKYRESLKVYRLEARFHRAWLKELDIDSVPDLKSRLGVAFSAIVNDRAGSWFRVLGGEASEQSNRRPVAGWFGEIIRTLRQDAGDWFADELVKRKVRKSHASLELAVDRAGKSVARAAAIARRLNLHSGEDPELFFNFIRSRWAVMLAREGSSWITEVIRQGAKVPDVVEPSDVAFVVRR